MSKVNIVGEETQTETNSWKISGSTATYGTSSKTLLTINGVKSINGLSLSNKTVTVSNSSLNKKSVTISSGYTLELCSDVTKSTSTAAKWTISGSTATYKSGKITAGYKLDNNKISYVKASGGEILITVSGVKSLSGLSLKNKTVTLSNSSLNKKPSQFLTVIRSNSAPTSQNLKLRRQVGQSAARRQFTNPNRRLRAIISPIIKSRTQRRNLLQICSKSTVSSLKVAIYLLAAISRLERQNTRLAATTLFLLSATEKLQSKARLIKILHTLTRAARMITLPLSIMSHTPSKALASHYRVHMTKKFLTLMM